MFAQAGVGDVSIFHLDPRRVDMEISYGWDANQSCPNVDIVDAIYYLNTVRMDMTVDEACNKILTYLEEHRAEEKAVL